MMGDSMTSLGLLVTSLVRGRSCRRKAAYQGLDTPPRPAEPASTEDPAPLHERVPASWWGTGLALSCALCVATSSSVFGLPVYETLVAVVLALLVAVLAVRALGETDLNPVSGVGKLSQVRPAVGAGGVLRVLWRLRVVWRCLTPCVCRVHTGQAVFALVSPGNVLSNLVAGAIAEAGVYTLL